MRRLVARTLLVVGGAVAGTAAAWALTTTSAAAAEAPQADIVTSIVSVDRHLPVPVPAKQFVDHVDETLRAEQEKARAALPAGEVKDVVDHVADIIQPRLDMVVHPAGKSGTEADPLPTPVATAVESAPADVTELALPFTGFEGEQLLFAPRDAESDEQRPSLPADPSPRMPVAPVNAPVHCGCGTDGSGSAGGQNSAAQAAFVNAYNSAVARALKPTSERISVRPGKQPGSTPD